MPTYISTRGRAGGRSFEEVLLAGLAEDGGLFVPAEWPRLARDDLLALRGRSYAETAAAVLAPYTEGCFDREALGRLCADAYAGFAHPATAPLKQLGADRWLLELFHGPTLAFKDFAMQLLARMFDAVLARRGDTITIVGATSGDTGAAAVRAFAGKPPIKIVMLHPKGRISNVQRRQMTTEPAANVVNIAIEGTFDDCQALVKAMLADPGFRDRLRLSAVNSINWARVAAQAAYYVYAALRLGAPDRKVAFCVPTGNFGNVYAGWVAAQAGLPIEHLVVACNSNDILARFFAGGTYAKGAVVPTISPSMDIQVASNFERLLHAAEGGDGRRVEAQMRGLDQSGGFTVAADVRDAMRPLFTAGRADEVQTKRTIRDVFLTTGEVIDPHTAVGLAVAERQELDPGVPIVTLATAHPGKFADAVAEATGAEPRLPPAFADLLTRPERLTVLPNDLHTVQAHIAEAVAA